MPLGNDWNVQTHNMSQKDKQIEITTDKLLGHRFPILSHKLASMFSLYNFLNAHKNTDPATLHITDEKGKPMFSQKDLKEIQATIRRQTSRPMTNDNARRIIEQVKNVYGPAINLAEEMKGSAAAAAGGARRRSRAKARAKARAKTRGGATVGVGVPMPNPSAPPPLSLRDPDTPGYDPNDDAFGAPQRPGFVDKAYDGFFDRIFLKLGGIYSNSPLAIKFSHKWDGIFWVMFLLYNLENMDFFGPFLSAGLDSYIVAVRMAVDALHENMPKLLAMVGGILPIGVGGVGGTLVGEGLSAAIGGILLMGTIIVSISRKHFGDAFKASLEMVPFVGDFLMTLAMSMEMNMDRLNNYRNKLIHQINSVSPRLYKFVDYWVPKLEIVPPDPAPPMPTVDDIKEDIIDKAMEATGVNKVLEKVQSVTDNPMGAVAGQLPPMPAMPTAPALPTMPAMPTAPALPTMPAMPTAPTLPTLPALPSNNLKASFAPTPVRKHERRRTRGGYKRIKRRHTRRR